MPRLLRRSLLALTLLLGLTGVLVATWAIDTRGDQGKVLRRVTLAGRRVSGFTTPQLRQAVKQVAAELPGQEVVIDAKGGGFTTDADALGLRVSEAATVRGALRVGREGTVPQRIWAWLGSFRVERRAPVEVSVDPSAVWATVAAKDPGPRKPPVEPSIEFRKGAFVPIEGTAGEGIDPAKVIDALPTSARHGNRMVVAVGRGAVAPRYSLEEATRLAGNAQAKVTAPVKVTAGTASATVPLATLRSWVTSEASDSGLVPKLQGKAALTDLARLLSAAGEPATETKFTVEGGAVRVAAGKAGTKCCGESAVARIERALFGDASSTAPISLPLTERPPKLSLDEAAALDIKEPISSFTTKHKAGEPRVRNIHRIADLVRGTVIEPGETFSINDTVGKRTAEQGFVNAPVIEEGKFSESIGGGISQFATTLFNAAFEGGLDFAAYQSHSIYISRYPYGREATLSYPAPDLAIKNTSPHGVLIWPTYTETSISVALYSTKFADVRQSGQSEAPRGACKRVTTERTRTYLADGRSEVDKVFATYRPGEGVNC